MATTGRQEKNPFEAIDQLLEKVDKKNFTIYFYTMDAKNYPLASQYELFFHARTLSEYGYRTCVVMDDTENKDELEGLNNELSELLKQKKQDMDRIEEVRARIRSLKNPYPKWMGNDFKNVDLKLLSEINQNTKVSPIDVFVIPEIFKDFAYHMAKNSLNTKNVMFVQDLTRFFTISIQDLSYVGDMKISNFIVTTEYARDLVKQSLRVDGELLKYHVLPPTIPEYFKPKPIKQPKIAILSRNSEDTKLFHKAFIERHPELKWVPFENLANIPRKSFADKVASSAVGVMIDRRATFGTFPLECAASHTYPAALGSDFDLPYTETNDENAFVVYSDRIVDIKRLGSDGNEHFYDLVEAVYRQMMQFLDGRDGTGYFSAIKANNIAAFENEQKKESIRAVYERIVEERRFDIAAQRKQMEENEQK